MLAAALHDPVATHAGARMTRWDVVVAGAGPGGSVAALALARGGASVLLVDRQAFPRWKVCGACLSPGALATLATAGLGDLVSDAGGVPLSRMSLFAGARRASLPLRGSMALSRAVLDEALVRAALSAGVTFLPEARAGLGSAGRDARTVLVTRQGHEEALEARVVIDATGLGRGLERLDVDEAAPSDEGEAQIPRVTAGSRVGLGATLSGSSYDVPAGELHMVVGRRGYVGLVRLEDGTLNVGAAVDPGALRTLAPAEAVTEILEEARRPALDGRLVHGWRGTPPLTRRSPAAGGERLFRLGDAAGYVEPFTGEGMCWALAAGVSVGGLARAGLGAWHPRLGEAWSAYQRRAMTRSRRLCRALAWALRRPHLVRPAVAALGRVPALAEPFVRQAGARPRPYAVGAR